MNINIAMKLQWCQNNFSQNEFGLCVAISIFNGSKN